MCFFSLFSIDITPSGPAAGLCLPCSASCFEHTPHLLTVHFGTFHKAYFLLNVLAFTTLDISSRAQFFLIMSLSTCFVCLSQI